jgi:hypothetical protein
MHFGCRQAPLRRWHSKSSRAGAATFALPLPQGEVSAPAKENECFHRALSLDVDAAMRLKLKVLVNVQTGRSRDLDAVRHATNNVLEMRP